ncbi:hypothetical protein JCM7686_pAMI5p052 (plasmid) [Paracoccus aminophilus JCM 7686]|uniref:Uncharacterized protein n=2 Tax=Paracoccus aminophilus TaxID=34003 RepID=S5YI27_PARAH|nr:hypothetical protein JCM7686_pAMI5p052 [Paracoccus aminophilus JCM 7686]
MAARLTKNILSMAAGHAALMQVPTAETSARFNALGDLLKIAMQARFERRGIAGCALVDGRSSIYISCRQAASRPRRPKAWIRDPASSGISK